MAHSDSTKQERSTMPNATFRIPTRELGNSPISVHVQDIGNLRMSKGRVIWRAFGAQKGTRISWEDLARLITENGVPE